MRTTLAEGLADVATELRLVNVLDLIAYVHADRSANLEDLVNSSAELYFKPGTLRYGWAADLDVRWDAVSYHSARHGVSPHGGDGVFQTPA